MVEHVGSVRRQSNVVPAGRCLIQASWAAPAPAQPSGAEATAPAPGTTSSITTSRGTAAFHLGSNPNHFAHAHDSSLHLPGRFQSRTE